MITADPLALNLHRQTRLLQDYLAQNSQYNDSLSGVSTARQLLVKLSSLLSCPPFTQIIATLFRPVLMDLCARWLEDAENSDDRFVALCLLGEVHEELFPILNQLILNVYPRGPLAFLDSHSALVPKKLHCILLAYHRILSINRELPQQCHWPLHYLSKVIWDATLDRGARLLAIRCYAFQAGMGEAERTKIEAEVLGKACEEDCPIHYGEEVDGSERQIDGWLLPITELERVQKARNDIISTLFDYYTPSEDQTMTLEVSDLSPLLANVHNVLLLRSSPIPSPPTTFVPVPSAISALRNIATHLSLRIPTLLTSQISGGKFTLLSHLAKLLHPGHQNQIVSIHLADTSLDARGLLGAYVSSVTRPGGFDWQEGVLVKAMREGKWVVLEDMDRGSNEVLGVVKPLVESLGLGKWIGRRASMVVPGRGKVMAHEHFFLFATRSASLSRDGSFSAPSFFGAHKFFEVPLQPYTNEDIQTIISTKFPSLSEKVVSAIIAMWDGIRRLPGSSSSREVGLRELEKFCLRVMHLASSTTSSPMDVDMDGVTPNLFQLFASPSIREEIFVHARDVFIGGGGFTTAARVHAQTAADVIGEHLGFDKERQAWVLGAKVPHLELEKDSNGRPVAVSVGQTRLLAKPVRDQVLPSSRPFVIHKPATILLGRIATAISHNEPVLLTGETGTGKTSIVSHLATLLQRPLTSLNLSQQTESSDLIGGLKPVDPRIPASVLQETYLSLFSKTFSRKKNEKFEKEVWRAVNDCKWKRAVGLWKESARMAMERLQAGQQEGLEVLPRPVESEAPKKRRKTDHSTARSSLIAWTDFVTKVEEFEVQHVHASGKFAFGFVEGPLIKAIRGGHWILLDEVNLASPETLECISSLLQGPTASITLTEHGSLEPVPRHPDFRLFACMNPATDVGKKDLPPNIRSRFTEIDVLPPDADKETLLSIINQYIGHLGDKAVVMDVAELYTAVKRMSEMGELADGSNHRPHFSMRTLTRALTFAAETAGTFGVRRAVWEGCVMAFTMTLDSESAQKMMKLAQKCLLAQVRNINSWLGREPAPPAQGSYFKQGPFYLEKGSLEHVPDDNYILTTSVHEKLTNLGRIILTGLSPVLIEGPTSSGKTSAVEYLARMTNHHFVRINNHDHTDIQEYLGSYVSEPTTGKLVFKDGLLVQALRHGYWIVLDELNLAPTDVLEALNRLLDDNRELLIPETQEVVRPHPHFRLFATQNPPGLYAGRKVLSRAFRNRFLEVHFEDVPPAELETILCQRCRIAPSYGKKIVNVFHQLQKRRQIGRVFDSKQGFATLRDLFRWAGRDAVGYQELAENGYMLLAERTRRAEDKAVVKEVIEAEMNVRIDEYKLYDLQRPDLDTENFLGCPFPQDSGLVWTKAMQRLYALVCRALRFNEPVLLVGETGSGKTSVCQVYADASGQRMLGICCHQNTETADILGGLRPTRNRAALQAALVEEARQLLETVSISSAPIDAANCVSTLKTTLSSTTDIPESIRVELQQVLSKLQHQQSIFEWHDGPLVEAMQSGELFLLDEISLADDSVLERLNSVLEPARGLTLAERGGGDAETSVIKADDRFKLVATMNPGGDYGKKELSPALRNRFTEIWVPAVDDLEDLRLIIDKSWKHPSLSALTEPMLAFVEWICKRVGDSSLLGLRDVLAWVLFINTMYSRGATSTQLISENFHHGARMICLDGLASFHQLSNLPRHAIIALRDAATRRLEELIPLPWPTSPQLTTVGTENHFELGGFAIPRGPYVPSNDSTFSFIAATTRANAVRVLRACQVLKPILLEGSPGVGKTSLIVALAKASGHHLCRINLSDQTDLMDLFGSDLPVEGGKMGEFAWKDAEFLKALQEGHWVLLDEMNLAPQAVLEGLNAVLDHRGSVYIPELNRTFTRHPSFRIFAAQNPLSQGGGRKGLPKSFVNRFTKVYVNELTDDDMFTVCTTAFRDVPNDALRGMVAFNTQLNDLAVKDRSFAQEGAPWEFNLRDLMRWCQLVTYQHSTNDPIAFLRTIYLDRLRTSRDREIAKSLFEKALSLPILDLNHSPPWSVGESAIHIGHFSSKRLNYAPPYRPSRLLTQTLSPLETLGHCINQSWLAILTGPRDSGKTAMVRAMAALTGSALHEISINSTTDVMDFLGSFEQVDKRRHIRTVVERFDALLQQDLRAANGARARANMDGIWSTLSSSLSHDLPSTEAIKSFEKLLENLASDQSIPENPYTALAAELSSILQDASHVGQFEWVDGPLVLAMKNGDWLLMDGANLCNPSVLDRLNSLCEPNGQLTMSERGFVNGAVQVLKPHPNFRLFMTVDPHHGELSRAMRNRGIEISLSAANFQGSPFLRDHLRLPLFEAAADTGHQEVCIFDSCRRGAVISGSDPLSILGTVGLSLDQDSAATASPASDVILSQLTAPYNDDDVNLPLSLVATRILSPAQIPYLLRRVFAHMKESTGPVQDFIATLLGFATSDRVLENVRREWSLGKGWDRRSTLGLPIDLHSSLLPSQEDEAEESFDLTPHGWVLRYLELWAALHWYQRKPPLHNVVKPSKQQNILLAGIERLFETARASCTMVLSRGNELDSRTLKTATSVLKLLMYLHRGSGSHLLDYSSLHATLRSLVTALEECHKVLVPIHNQVTSIQELISLTSGQGLLPIWKATQEPLLSSSTCAQITAVEASVFQTEISAASPESRKRAVDLICMLSLPEKLVTTQIASAIESGLSGVEKDPAHFEDNTLSCVPPLGSLLELQYMHSLAKRDSEISQKLLTQLVSLFCHEPTSSLRHLIPFQHFLWYHETHTATASSSLSALVEWLRGIWVPGREVSSAATSPVLSSPVILRSAIEACNLDDIPLQLLTGHEGRIRRLSQAIFAQGSSEDGRVAQLRMLCLQTISLVLDAARGNSVLRVHSSPEDFKQELANVVEEEMPIMNFTTLLKAHFQPVLCPTATQEGNLWELGAAWVGLGRFLFDALVPSDPIDPAMIEQCTSNRAQAEAASISFQLALHARFERLWTGNSESEISRQLEKDLERSKGEGQKTGTLPDRRDLAQLHSFWSEVVQFQQRVVSPSKLDPVMDALAHGSSDGEVREGMLQDSLGSFSQRLDAAYPDFGDLVRLLQLAILSIRLGLRLLTTSYHLAKSPTSMDILPQYPAIAAQSKASGPNIGLSTTKTPFQTILTSMAELNYRASAKVNDDATQATLRIVYDQAIGIWLMDRAKEKDSDAAASSLYRTSGATNQMWSDEEIEREEFLNLFPDFEDAVEQQLPSGEKKPSYYVSDDGALTMFDLHLSINAVTALPGALERLHRLRFDAINARLATNDLHFPMEVDERTTPFQLRALHGLLRSLRTGTLSAEKPLDFYHDPHLPEFTKARFVLTGLSRRLQSIIQEWPDQMVLRHILERCDTILSLPSSLPLARLVSALEQLLLHTEDWEMYANRDNTLKQQREEIIDLIVSWRRLELSSWKGLLDSEQALFRSGVSSWWFRLYDLLVRGALAAAEESEEDEKGLTNYLRSLVPLLDEFFMNSPLGQFDGRIELLQSFGNYISSSAAAYTEVERGTLARVLSILKTTLTVHTQSSGKIAKVLDSQKATLEAEVKAFIKLASWKDVNVHALKQSAQKTHHQLFKIIRKFRDVLRQPSATHLQPDFAYDERSDRPVTEQQLPYVTPSFDPNVVASRFAGTVKKMESYLSGRILPTILDRSASYVEDFSVEIISTSKSLAEAKAPAGVTADVKAKFHKGLQARKRKTWSELLKALKTAGLSTSSKPDVLKKTTDALWTREQPAFLRSTTDGVVGRSESYFARLIKLMPDLRASLMDHHPDVQTRELERARNSLESAVLMGADLRSRLIHASQLSANLRSNQARLRQILSEPALVHNAAKNVLEHVQSLRNVFCRSLAALEELQDDLDILLALDSDQKTQSDAFAKELGTSLGSASRLREQIITIEDELKSTPVTCLTKGEWDTINEAKKFLEVLPRKLSDWRDQCPPLCRQLTSIKDWFVSQDSFVHLLPAEAAPIPGESVDLFVNSVLVSVQALLAQSPGQQKDEKESDEDGPYISKGVKATATFTHLLNLDGVSRSLHALLRTGSSDREVLKVIESILPFLDLYLSVVDAQLDNHANWTKGVHKLAFIICSLLKTLSQQGFCRPPDDDGKQNGEDGAPSEGLGIGEGTGEENVSSEIQEESQVEGLKGEEESKEKQERNEDDDAIEMSEDIGGDLEDVEEKEGDEAQSEDEEDLDETLDKLDSLDPSTVDEKIWGDEQGKDDGEDKVDQDRSKEEGEGESEMVPKEGQKEKEKGKDKDENEKDKDKEQSKEEKPEGEAPEVEDLEGQQEGEQEQDGMEEDAPGPDGAPLDSTVQDADTLDLPEDLNLGEDGMEQEEEQDLDMDMDMGDDEAMPEDGQVEQMDTEEMDDLKDDMGDEGQGDAGAEDAQATDEPPEEEMADPTLPVTAQVDVTQGDGQSDPSQANQPRPGESGSASGGASIGAGEQAQDGEKEKADSQPAPPEGSEPDGMQETETSGATASGKKEGQAPSSAVDTLAPNPLRSLGDTTKEVRQRFDEILNPAETDVPVEQVAGADEASQIEYLKPDDVDHDMQALGPAGEEQMAKLDQLKLVDDIVDLAAEPANMDVDPSLPLEKVEESSPADRWENDQKTATLPKEDIPGALQAPQKGNGAGPEQEDGDRTEVLSKDEEQEHQLELELRKWRANDYPESGAEALWRSYEALTHELAYTLCEQLRLILEPTLATRLKGDYRTGKRLNMKKIIPYIASDYAKDKIWLRRTKPSQREYQVLISIDDSRSMAESHSIHLAYQTVALISKALGRLESGDIAIAKFGETVELLHGFDEGPFTDQAGSKIVNSFRFNQKATNVLSLLENSLKVLEHARERRAMSSATAGDLWQLQFIVSDGMCQDHEKLRMLLRQAEEQRVMVVFIILDSLHTTQQGQGEAIKASILSMDKAEFTYVNGKMELQLRKYLDTFPFEYYLVLRDVESLPDVLSATLKQFFERISED